MAEKQHRVNTRVLKNMWGLPGKMNAGRRVQARYK